MSVFAKYEEKAWPYRFAGQIHIAAIAGGTPSDPQVAESWLRKKLGVDQDDLIRDMVSEVMLERNIGKDDAAKVVEKLKHLNGFKRDEERGLYIEGRQLKAALKEACSVAVAGGKLDLRGWGKTNKGLVNFVAEHICVVEDRLYLGADKPTDVIQSFPKNQITGKRGIQYTEYVEDAKVDFTVKTDWNFTEEQWAVIWLTGAEQGIGASRSQGFGRYTVTRWDRIS